MAIVTEPAPHIVLQLPLHGFEGVANCDLYVLMVLEGALVLRIALHDQFVPGHAEEDRDMERLVVLVFDGLAAVMALDRYAAACDAVEVLLELRDLGANAAFERVRLVDSVKSDM